MRATFLHLGDVHLGHEQYGRRERAEDFAEAFQFAASYAIKQKVNFVVVAGDLFERSTLDPITFDQALSILRTLGAAGIPLIAIAGNHDRARYGQGMAWLESLGRQGFLVYLDAATPEGIRLEPWSSERGIGGYLDTGWGLRLVGFRYLGAQTPRAVIELAEQMKSLDTSKTAYTVGLLHGGLDGIVPNFRAEVSYEQLTPLKGLVDYLALGHIHQQYNREGWVYNPGSLETWNVSEVPWERGFFHVTIDTSTEPKHQVKLITPPRRPFLRYRLEVEPCLSPQDLLELVRRSAAEWAEKAHAKSPVVYLTLAGRLRFDRHALDLQSVQTVLEETFEPLIVQVRDQTDETSFEIRTPDDEGALDRSALELDVLRQLFANDERRVHRAVGWAKLAQSLKQGTLAKESPETLAELVRKEVPALSAASPEPQGAGIAGRSDGEQPTSQTDGAASTASLESTTRPPAELEAALATVQPETSPPSDGHEQMQSTFEFDGEPPVGRPEVA